VTVIAWDGTTLAGDKRCTTKYGLISVVTKVRRRGEELVAMSGSESIAFEMFAWYDYGAKPEEFPQAARDANASMAVVARDGLRLYTNGPYPELRDVKKLFVMGTGGDIALGAMAAGRNATEAVLIANEYCAWCGNGVDTLTFEAVTTPTLSVVR
jgi:hypothetical protein